MGNLLRERMLFKQKHTKTIESSSKSKTAMRFNLEIGEENPQSDEGSNIYWKLSALENPNDYFGKLGLPRDSGCGIIIDFTLTDNITDEEITSMCTAMKILIMEHFGNDLQRSLQFKGLFLFPSKCTVDDSSIVRCALLFRRQISVDNFLQMMHIPYTLTDMLYHVSGEITTNMTISDIFDRSTVPFDNYFKLTVSLDFIMIVLCDNHINVGYLLYRIQQGYTQRHC